MADIFISYKRSERSQVEKIADLLREENFDVWFDAKLEVGRDEGFQSQIEREVTSAGCVLVCWSQESSKSIWVKGEAMKGLERNAFVPIFISNCSLPLPFNAVDTANLSAWNGDRNAIEWIRLIEVIRKKVNDFRADEKQKMHAAAEAYGSVEYKVYPGTLKLLVQRIAALHELDRDRYVNDIKSILEWLAAIAEKELNYIEDGYKLADRQPGGSAWYFWEKGDAATMATKIDELRKIFATIDTLFSKSQAVLNYQAP